MTVKKMTLQEAAILLQLLEGIAKSEDDPDPSITPQEAIAGYRELANRGIVRKDWEVTPPSLTLFMNNLANVLKKEGSTTRCSVPCFSDAYCRELASSDGYMNCDAIPLWINCDEMSIEFFSSQTNPGIADIKKGDHQLTTKESSQCECRCTVPDGRVSFRKKKASKVMR